MGETVEAIPCFYMCCLFTGMIRAGPPISEAQASKWNPEAVVNVTYKKPVYLTVMDYFAFSHGVAARGNQNCWKVDEHHVHAQVLEQIQIVCKIWCFACGKLCVRRKDWKCVKTFNNNGLMQRITHRKR